MSHPSALRSLLRPGPLLRLGIAIACAIAIWIGISAWIGDRTSVTVAIGSRPVDLLSPQWLHLAAVIPAFFVLRLL
jgi:hypothetical protein